MYKEKPFVMDYEGVLVQGIIDVFWLENDKIVLLDYKTDRVNAAKELIDRYSTQLKLYADALGRIFSTDGKSIQADERLIYSFRLQQTIVTCREYKKLWHVTSIYYIMSNRWYKNIQYINISDIIAV